MAARRFRTISWSRGGRTRGRGGTASSIEQEISMSSKKTLIAMSVAVALGIVGAASAAWANDSGENHQDNDKSVSSSVAPVNPVWLGTSAAAGGAYGYAAPVHKHRPVQDRAPRTSDRIDDNR